MSSSKREVSFSSASPWSIPTTSSNHSAEQREQPTAGPSTLPVLEDEQDDGSEQPKGKKQKFSRSRTACLPCRSRKSKCGASPPEPCPNCIEANIQCTWPSEDGRSSKARMQKAQHAFLARGMGGVQPDLLSMASGGAQVDDGWLERFLAAGQIGATPTGESLPIGMAPSPASNLMMAANTLAPPHPYPNAQTPLSTFLNALRSPEDPTPGSFLPGAIGNGMSTVYAQPNGANGMTLPQSTPTDLDPAQFIWAVSSQLPQVEESSPYEERGSSISTGPSPNVGENGLVRKGKARDAGADGGKLVKITWWRPHGATAIAPGLKKITLKVRVTDNAAALKTSSPRAALHELDQTPQQLIDPNGMPSPPIMRHLLEVFFVHFGSQFPFLNKAELDNQVESGTGSAFLFNAIAAIAARFSTHPAIAVPHLQPHAYGNVFNDRAKVLFGSMLGVPSRETVMAFVLLSHVSFANDCESDLWMHTGCAVRMAYDLGLHLDSSEAADTTAEEARLNRLIFWSVLIMDHALAFGVGRQTTFRLEDITQALPTEDDIHPAGAPLDTPRSAFPYAAKQMLSYGPLINMLNSNHADQDPVKLDAEIQSARASAMVEYNLLPEDMQWNVGNLQRHNRANQSPIFLQLHCWMHLILASAFLTGTNILRRSKHGAQNGAKSGAATPNSATANSLWRNSARTIGDILVLSDIINSHSYLALPFVNQAFYVAGCCYVKEIEQHQSSPTTPAGSPKRVPANLSMTVTSPPKSPSPPPKATKDPRQAALSRALLTSVATNNISTLQQGLAKQTTYWSGVAWVAGALAQRIEGIGAQDVDLVNVTEKLGSYVSLPDAGSLPRASGGRNQGAGNILSDAGITPRTWNALVNGLDGGTNGFGDMDFMSLPFDLGSIEGLQNVTEQDVPLQSFGAEWFR